MTTHLENLELVSHIIIPKAQGIVAYYRLSKIRHQWRHTQRQCILHLKILLNYSAIMGNWKQWGRQLSCGHTAKYAQLQYIYTWMQSSCFSNCLTQRYSSFKSSNSRIFRLNTHKTTSKLSLFIISQTTILLIGKGTNMPQFLPTVTLQNLSG